MKPGPFFRIRYVFLLFSFWLLGVTFVQAQYYAGGQSPGSLKWKQINSAYFQIIFPEGFENQANYVANVLEYARLLDAKSLNNYPPKISILLHNQTVISNGEVGWAPRRVEFFTQPPQDIYAQDWLQQLALHEYRHVVQIDKMNQGLTRILFALFGQQITVGVYGLYVPWWFIEGDAVVTETALSKAGRGRQALFEMELRAQLLQKGMYSYDKAAHGSYKNYVPSHYHLGYYLVGYGRARYGTELWEKALNNVARKPWMISPFSNAIKKQTGLTKNEFYKEGLKNIASDWEKQNAEIEKTSFWSLTKTDKGYVNYLNPVASSLDMLVSVKEDYQDIRRLVMLDQKGNEQNILALGAYYSESLTAKSDLVCWAEYDADPRWAYRINTRLYLYSTKTQKKRLISSGKRYFSPSFNSQATKLVVVESSVNYQHQLAVLELNKGLKEREYKTEANDFLSYPAWSADDKKLLATALGKKGKSLVEFDVETGDYRYLLPFSSTDISKAIYWKEYVLYQGAYSGISNIYALSRSTGKIYQLTSSAFGAHSPQLWNNQLLYLNYTAYGNQIALAELEPTKWKPLNKQQLNPFPLAQKLQQQEDTLMLASAIPDSLYPVKKYSKIGHLINPHSWGPFSVSMDNYSFQPGASVSSQNKLSTFFLSLGYSYDRNQQEGTWFSDVTYLGWYPAFNFRAEYGYRERLARDAQNDSTFLLRYNQTNLRSAVYVPLYYASGSWYQYIEPRVRFEYTQMDVLTTGVSLLKSNYKIFDLSLNISNYKRSALQDVYPRWGQHFGFLYRMSPFDSSGNLLALNTTLFFPGLFKHQGLRFYAAFQQRFGDAGFYADQMAFARGYTGLNMERAFSYKFDYKLPVAYPDYNLGALLYIKRITLAVFYDETIQQEAPNAHYRSLGNDLLFDVHFMRSFVPFSIGVRSVYLIDSQKPFFGFLASIKL